MKKIRLLALALAVMMLAGVFTGCSSQSGPSAPASSDTPAADTPKESEKLLIGLSVRGLDNPYYVELVEGVQQFVDQTPGAEIVLMEHHGDDQKEVNDVKAFAARGEKAILYIDPQSAAVCTEVAEICEENEIYWTSAYTLGKDIYPWNYHYFVSHQALDDVTAGYEVAKYMFESFEGKDATILCMAGELSNLASINRIKGLEKALAEYPNVKLLDTQPADWDSQKALNVAQTWLAKYSDVDGIWVANDGMAVAVVEALKSKSLNGKIQVTGVDCIPTGVDAIKAGDMAATFYPYPACMGGYGVAMAYAALTGKIDPDKLTKEESCYLTPGVLVTKENIDTYKSTQPELNFDDPLSWGIGPLKVEE